MAAVRAVKMRIALSSPRKEGMNSRDVAELEQNLAMDQILWRKNEEKNVSSKLQSYMSGGK